jgi:tRNA A-37 threonylcarbamoyl transferase component Bud32
MSSSESHCAVVLELAEEFLERYRQGQRPSLKEYADRHPELADEIREVFPAMALMENIALADESLAGGETPPGGGSPPEGLRQLGDFRIIREVGHGGMGIVYEAEQVSLGRHVALKVLTRKMLLEARRRRRFEREARAAAKLHHTNIVPVFGVGEHDGLPYYVMQFIQGLGLDEVLDQLKRMQAGGTPATTATAGDLRVARQDVSAVDVARSLLTGEFQPARDGVEPSEATATAPRSPGSGGRRSGSSALSSSSVSLPGPGGAARGKARKLAYWQSVARVGVQVAEALAHAHGQGILHRDIKPSNLLLDTGGTVWVADFGLARAEEEDQLTHSGEIVGTLRYMPPEAFEGRSDQRSDLYSLGLTLYELLALRPAFEETNRHWLMRVVAAEEPPRLDRLNPQAPRDLVTIIHKAIEREPERRYPTAGDMAADLQRFLDDEPIQARRVGAAEHAWRWCRRHPGVATLTAALALLLVGVTLASVLAAARFDRLAQDQAAVAANEGQARQAADEAKEREAA